jgi:hypothetical protein
MTQQPYAPQYPGYPGAAPQQYPTQGQYPAYPQQPYPGQQFQQQQYAPQAPQPPAQPLAKGTLDDYYSQPSAGSGPSISWSNPDKSPKPIGTSYAGIVARPVTNADIQQQTDPATQQPKFFRDGRPMFVMTVPLKVQPSAEFPDGQATWFVRGQARDELVRAMAEAGAPAGPPEHNAFIVVTLVQRRPSRMGNAANIVQVQYTRPQGAAQPGSAAGLNVEQNGQQGTVVTSPAPSADPYYVPPAQVIDNYPNQPQAQTVPQGPGTRTCSSSRRPSSRWVPTSPLSSRRCSPASRVVSRSSRRRTLSLRRRTGSCGNHPR